MKSRFPAFLFVTNLQSASLVTPPNLTKTSFFVLFIFINVRFLSQMSNNYSQIVKNCVFHIIFSSKYFFRTNIWSYICNANKERRLVVKPVHLNFNYWKRTIENERPAVQRVSCFSLSYRPKSHPLQPKPPQIALTRHHKDVPSISAWQ